ncbi:MAG: translation initiation factor IF-2 [Alphaproteobacteria bacterium]|nr:translation initiation factor IF-2 [Alphaproteobacteria bacterium]
MTDENKADESNPKTLTLKRSSGRLEMKKTVETGQVRQSFSHGRSRVVAVEVRKKRSFGAGGAGEPAPAAAPAAAPPPAPSTPSGPSARSAAKSEAAAPPPPPPLRAASPAPMQAQTQTSSQSAASHKTGVVLRTLSDEEKAARARAVGDAVRAEREARARAEEDAARRAADERRFASERQEAERRAQEEAVRRKVEEDSRRRAEEEAARRLSPTPGVGEAPLAPMPGAPVVPSRPAVAAVPGAPPVPVLVDDDDEAGRARRKGEVRPKAPVVRRDRDAARRGSARITVVQALHAEEGIERARSVAAFRRQRERERRLQLGAAAEEKQAIVREVVLPETITVQELASRMAVRVADVVKSLFNMGSPVTVTQSIDADTAELIVAEFGHKVKRVSESDVEIGLKGKVDEEGSTETRPPVVTIMGHVDHGKTSLLDALRATDVAAGEAGGITQHIGAYQVETPSGKRITFIDTPGHEAFTQMRARGAKVTDIVVLVVAADDGVMPQTVEALNHAKAAGVPMIIAVNKIDKPDAKPERVRNELLSHGIVTEENGGDVLSIEVSATKKLNLGRLEEAILLQAEILELKANPNRPAEGAVLEAKIDRGRGVVSTLLVQRGTLHVGDIVVAGAQWGRVRALVDDKGKNVAKAGPAMPIEVLGLQDVPDAGDEFVVVENERRAREVTEFRTSRARAQRAAGLGRATVEQMISSIGTAAAQQALPVVVKADVHGSVEAIVAALEKLSTSEVSVRVLHSGVGGITESDVTLAQASKALIVGFNVRANQQARELAKRDGVNIRYYAVIYDIVDDARAALEGMLKPTLREHFLGNAQVLQVFDISKIGKVAGCRVTEGTVKRGARVRLVRDNVVIHDGSLKTLKRFKEEVREVKEGFECGMAFENYHDLREGDVLEFYELEEVARTLGN